MKALWLFALAPLLGCSVDGATVGHFGSPPASALPSRSGAAFVEGCALDSWQTETLASSAARQALGTVILSCASARDDGTIAPAEASAQGELAQQVKAIHALGYRVEVALTMLDELDQAYPPDVMQASLGSATWRAAVVASVAPFAAMSDGIDLELSPPPDAARQDVTALVQALSVALRPGKALSIFAPPAGPTDDVPGANAYDVASIAPLVDRVRLETLDFSPAASPGPTIDPGWAVDVERAAAGEVGATPLDVAYPLYGWDFGPQGQQRVVTFAEAQGMAADSRATVRRGPTQAPYFDWVDPAGGAHETWFDDATSTAFALRAWDPQTLPSAVGVVYWSLGSEDPALWQTVAAEGSAP